MRRATRRRLAPAAVLLACVLGLGAYLRYAGPLPGDHSIYLRASANPRLRSSHMLQFLGDLGTTSVALVTIAVAGALIGRAIDWLAGAAVLASSLGVLLSDALRTTLGPTPSSQATFGADAASYPSGHTVYATAVFGMLAVLARRHGRHDAAVVPVALIVAMGPARVLSAAHLPSDVLGGYLLGGAWLLVVLAAYDVASARLSPGRSA